MYRNNTPLKKELIYIDGKDKTNDVQSYSFVDNKCFVIYKNNNTSYSYNKSRIEIVKSGIKSKKAETVFSYLRKIAETVGLTIEKDKNILADSYAKISFISERSILSDYLNGTMPETNSLFSPIDIFPFGFNISQKEGVNKAFSCPLSVIEGPPGTGKTQTILNIIANAVMNGQSVAVVSSNNSATKNVYEKLDKNGISFIAALLGSSKNKKEFIESQAEIPDLSSFQLSEQQKEHLQQTNRNLFVQLTENLAKMNELALLKLEIENIKTEYEHFKKDINTIQSVALKRNITSDNLLSLWIRIENQEKSEKKIGWWKKLIFHFKYGIKDNAFFDLSYQNMIKIVQSKYYATKISELSVRKEELKKSLKIFSFDNKMEEYTRTSMKLFKNELYKKYKGKQRTLYTERELRSKSEDFMEDYPVIMSTTYSLRRSLADKVNYDFVIIDESSQVDLATGALALSCARRAVIVGDLKQLPNVVDADKEEKTNLVFDSFNLPEAYRYSNHNLLSSIIEVFPEIPKTLLKEHYRCHPKIIEFCNRKFYNNQLIILSESKSKRKPLIVYRTAPGNHARERMNQRQIDVITQEIIPQQQLENVDLGIVTPYRNQSVALQNTFNGTQIKADTVDKFQGRENEVIILSTVDNEISEFADNPNRLNVAISRAIEQLIILVNGNDSENDSNISDLIRYIDYNDYELIDSNLRSIFDYLYKGYEQKKRKILSTHGKKSLFDSENLMYTLIKNVLSQDRFSKYDIILHFPLQNLILDFSKLTDQEEKYAKHHLTHLDFLIYNKLGKNPVLAIEVDGYEYHKQKNRQSDRDRMKNNILEKYGMPLLRFSTTGSGESQKLVNKLNELTK